MKQEHKRPLGAFASLSVVCALLLGHGLGGDAVGERLGVRLSAGTDQRTPTPAPATPVSPSTVPSSEMTPAPPPTPAQVGPTVPPEVIEVLGQQANVEPAPSDQVVPQQSFLELPGSGLSLADLLARARDR